MTRTTCSSLSSNCSDTLFLRSAAGAFIRWAGGLRAEVGVEGSKHFYDLAATAAAATASCRMWHGYQLIRHPLLLNSVTSAPAPTPTPTATATPTPAFNGVAVKVGFWQISGYGSNSCQWAINSYCNVLAACAASYGYVACGMWQPLAFAGASSLWGYVCSICRRHKAQGMRLINSQTISATAAAQLADSSRITATAAAATAAKIEVVAAACQFPANLS